MTAASRTHRRFLAGCTGAHWGPTPVASEIGIAVRGNLEVTNAITDIPNLAVVCGGVDVAHQSVQTSVTLFRPVGNPGGKSTNRT